MKKVLLIMCLAVIVSGCKTNERLVEVVRMDSTIVTHETRDSIYIQDSIYMRDKGDTVLVEKWHTRWRERTIHDTLYISHHDSVPVPYPVIKEVEREQTRKERLLIQTGRVVMLFGVVLLVYGLWSLWRKLRE